ncbi:MAG: O-antigen ligase family protein [Chitinophagales bacterium]|nr:O-antigen ligase family protein [Chitinophagales bacterium]
MKKLFIINDTTENKITYYHLAAFVFFLPFDRLYSELTLISLLLHSIIHVKKEQLRNLFTLQNGLLTAVFLLGVIALAWSDDKGQGIKDLQRQLAILLIPVIFSLLKINLARYKKNILLFLAISCTLTILYLYTDAFHIILFYEMPVRSILSISFINHNFSEPVGIHATYLSLYSALSLSVVIQYFIEEKKSARLWMGIMALILLAGLVQLASKAVLISALLYCCVALPFFIKQPALRKRIIITSLTLSALVIFSISHIDTLKRRYIETFREDLARTSLGSETAEPRLSRWKIAWQLIGKSPAWGHGSGSEKRLLNEKYFENKLYQSYLLELNAHNQYLSFLIKTGIAGLFVFLVALVAGTRTALQNKDSLFACFLILVIIVSFSENILDVNKGIFFYAFFFALFIKPGKPFAGIKRFSKKQLRGPG